MVKKAWIQQRSLRWISVMSIIAAFVAWVGDEVFQYSSRGYESLVHYQHLPLWRMFTGHLLGVLGIPLCLAGYWCVCQALLLSGVKGARVMFWGVAYGLVMGTIAHDNISAVIETMRVGSSPALTDVANYMQSFSLVPGFLFLLSYFAISTWYFVAVVSGRTLYARWMAWINPFLLSLFIALLHALNVLPVVVNVLWPAWLSFPHVVFFALTTWVLWNFKEDHQLATLERIAS